MEMSPGASDVVAHKYLFYNELAIFRVDKTTTLKIAYYLIANDLRVTPNYLLFNIGKFFSGLDKIECKRAWTRAHLLRHVDLLVGKAALLGTEAHYMAFDGSVDGAGELVRILP